MSVRSIKKVRHLSAPPPSIKDRVKDGRAGNSGKLMADWTAQLPVRRTAFVVAELPTEEVEEHVHSAECTHSHDVHVEDTITIDSEE
jgi:hypothetical protein